VTGLDTRALAAIFAGGFVGALARVGLAEAWPAQPAHWPWATFVANVAGAFALGWVVTRMPDESHRRSFVASGLLGALTTFSTMQLELLQMLDDARCLLAATYAAASVAIGLAAVALATGAARRRAPP
jgi:CrcB protein